MPHLRLERNGRHVHWHIQTATYLRCAKVIRRISAKKRDKKFQRVILGIYRPNDLIERPDNRSSTAENLIDMLLSLNRSLKILLCQLTKESNMSQAGPNVIVQIL